MMNKKMVLGITLMVMAVLLVLSIVGCSGKKSDGSTSNRSIFANKSDPETDFRAEPIDGGKGVAITGYVGSKWEISIPSKIQNIPVTQIGKRAFRGKSLVSVTIPNSVTSIGEEAFENNQLTSITIPKSVIYIEDYAFGSNPIISVTIGPNVEFEGEERGADYNEAFDEGLVELYIRGGKSAGTYTRPNANSETWTKK